MQDTQPVPYELAFISKCARVVKIFLSLAKYYCNTTYLLVHGQVTISFVVSVCLSVYLFVCLSVCLFVQSFSQPSSIRFGSN